MPILYENRLDSILNEEQIWANEANIIREKARKQVKALIYINIVIAIIFVIIVIKTIIKGKVDLELDYEEYDIKYFRDIPNEKEATPARALYMKCLDYTERLTNIGGVFAGTILDLVLKGFIEIEPIDSKSAKFKLKNSNIEELTYDESLIYGIIKLACEKSSEDSITTKELEKYCQKNYKAIYSKIRELEASVKRYGKIKIDKDKMSLHNKYLIKSAIYFVAGCFLVGIIMYFPTLCISAAILGIINFIYVHKIEVLTEEGYREKKEWNGLQKYMEDFSLLKDKEIPDLILWEKYLVYATTFGISKKVIEQLKVVYPQLMEDSTYMNENYMYLHYIANLSYGFDFFGNLDKTLSKSYRSAETAYMRANSSNSSALGGGGGFSGGGRRRRRWRKLRWSLKYNKRWNYGRIFRICKRHSI